MFNFKFCFGPLIKCKLPTCHHFVVLFCSKQESLSLRACIQLMSVHDKFHMMYKRKCAGNNPESFRQSKTFMSFHGFLR